ncbi:hypothetical protein Vretimale_18510 [Volvox reticuliferus]|uniref:Uncharacterized protein n=1 Tax=Volvox reticuliferus TaxID=1737510 RepID=A0A8J4GXF4_9CHLO|nr:hypothetical protein Vretifemale_19688 [Volvox reticuliferus]GIM15796.1 hypothetical protein Vretimale_18510 [Volvox reticuliferus]
MINRAASSTCPPACNNIHVCCCYIIRPAFHAIDTYPLHRRLLRRQLYDQRHRRHLQRPCIPRRAAAGHLDDGTEADGHGASAAYPPGLYVREREYSGSDHDHMQQPFADLT